MRNKAIGNIHETHLISLVKTDRSKYKTNSHSNGHMSKIYCLTCQKPINFASIAEWNYWNEKRYTDMRYVDFVDDFISNIQPKQKQVQINPVINENTYMINLEVPYAKKDVAKNLGAKWDPVKKKWYTYNYNPNIEKLRLWMHPDDEHKLTPVVKHNQFQNEESHGYGVSKLRQLLLNTPKT